MVHLGALGPTSGPLMIGLMALQYPLYGLVDRSCQPERETRLVTVTLSVALHLSIAGLILHD